MICKNNVRSVSIITNSVILVKAVRTVERKSTNDLQNELMTATDIGRFLSENREAFVQEDLSELLQELLQRCGYSKAAVAKRSGMSEVYLHQIFSGMRNPSRNRIICLCFGLSVSVPEAQELLRRSGNAQLYSRNRRDAIILYALRSGMPLEQLNDQLFSEQEKTLY